MRKFIKVCAIVIIVMIGSIVGGNRVLAGTHYVEILTPSKNRTFTELYKTDYEYRKGITPTERNVIPFHFTLNNDDGYYLKYDAFIDDTFDDLLSDLGWGTKVINYPVEDFLQKYGRGTHTFTLKCYHGIPYTRPPFGLQKGDNPDNTEDIYWVDPNQGYILELSDEVAVEFSVNPPLCHFVGFGYTDAECWQGNILPFRDLLLDRSAHYLEGYFKTEFYWTPSIVEETINILDDYEDPQDIDVIIFSTHGTEEGMWDYTTEQVGGRDSDILSPSELRTILSVLDSQNLIVIIHACHSGTFLPSLSSLTNIKHIIATCQSWETESDAHGHSTYDPSWSLKEKIKAVGPWFLRFFYNYLYDSYDNFKSFQRARDDIENAHLAYTPVHICDLFDLILYVNIGG